MKTALIYLPEDLLELHFDAVSRARLDRMCRVQTAFGDLANLPAADLAEVEIVLTGWSGRPLNQQAVAALPALRLIAHLGGSVRGAATRDVATSGISITHGAQANARPVAEYTLAMILLANKDIPRWLGAFAGQRDGMNVDVLTRHNTLGNCGRTIGIVGASRTGREVIRLLAQHDLDVLVADPIADSATIAALGARHVPLDTLLSESDVVSLHQPLLEQTRKSFGAAQFARMREGATFINTARGAIVDTDALTAVAQSGRINAILDVTDPEPLPADHPLWSLPNVLITPHMAGSTGNEVLRMTHEVLDDVERFIAGQPMQNAFAPAAWEHAA